MANNMEGRRPAQELESAKNVTKEELEKIAKKKLNFMVKKDGLILASSFEDLNLGDDAQDTEGSPYEWFQIFDEKDHPYRIEGNDVVLYRKECHGKGRIENVYHRGTDVWIVNPKNELMVPVRSAKKDLYSSMGDNSVSEHNSIREPYLGTAVRGFQEELGISVPPEGLSLVCKFPVHDKNQWQWSQYYVFPDKEGKYNPSEEEIGEVRWIPLQNLFTEEGIKKINFRLDHLPALKVFLEKIKNKK
ncbi:NUDIX domain-containing protein [Patescibacteria group bacterium]|nr:NUDIX domain-containing protein [Patescibacteria group bacterium]MBU1673982.1 NUDIX domain-containing protein [Patescibacteria group bacterium]MBU1962944.1 NUDIX domain-containing protein [Patescibacteria group bacterium]